MKISKTVKISGHEADVNTIITMLRHMEYLGELMVTAVVEFMFIMKMVQKLITIIIILNRILTVLW